MREEVSGLLKNFYSVFSNNHNFFKNIKTRFIANNILLRGGHFSKRQTFGVDALVARVVDGDFVFAADDAYGHRFVQKVLLRDSGHVFGFAIEQTRAEVLSLGVGHSLRV